MVGGALSLGLGSTIGALRDRTVAPVVAAAVTEAPEAPVEKPATPKFTGFGKKTATTAVAAEASAAVAETAPASKTSVADTVAALEQAKTDIAVALGVEPPKAAAGSPRCSRPEPEEKTKRPMASSMWWRKKSFAAARRGCFPMAPWKPKPTTAGCALKTSNTSTNISKLWCPKHKLVRVFPSRQ